MTATTTVIRTSTAKLKVGDVIQHGNIFSGFYYTTVVELNQSGNPASRMIQVMQKFEHGGVGGYWEGKNGIWYVVPTNEGEAK